MSTDAVPRPVQQRIAASHVETDDVRIIDIRLPLERTLPEALPARSAARWLLRLHEAGPHPLPILADAVVVFAASMLIDRRGAAVLTAAFAAAAVIGGVYTHRSRLATAGALWYVRAGAVPMALAAVAAATVAGTVAIPAAAAATSAVALMRTLTWWTLAAQRREGLDLEPVLVVGDPATAAEVERRIDIYPELGVRPGFRCAITDAATCVLAIQRLRLGHYPHLLIAGQIPGPQLGKLLDAARERQVTLTLVPSTSPIGLARSAHRLGNLTMLPLGWTREQRPSALMRALDIAVSALALLLLLPVFAVVALAIRLEDGGPALYRQQRVGRDGRTFEILKFRSMHVGAEDLQASLAHINDAEGLLFKISQDPRVTRVGSLIRRFSLDELPQFLNVLRGDMALVGPRPLAVTPEHFGAREALRHRVRPGVTGLWQVSGGNLLSYADMIELDLTWLATRTFAVDLGIMFRTVPAVLWPRQDHRRRR